MANYRCGSKTVPTAPKSHFRMTPINGHRRGRSACLKRANKRHCADLQQAPPPTCPAHDIPESLRGRQRCRDSGNPRSYAGDVRLQALVDCKRRWRPASDQSRDTDSPARSGAYAASLRDTNSVKSRTRFVLRVSPCVRSQTVPYMCRSVPGTLTSRGSASPMKHGSVVIPSPCRTATICASASAVLNGTPVVRTSPSLAQSGIP